MTPFYRLLVAGSKLITAMRCANPDAKLLDCIEVACDKFEQEGLLNSKDRNLLIEQLEGLLS